MNIFFILLFFLFIHASAKSYLGGLLNKLQALEAYILFDNGKFVVLDVVKVYGDGYPGVKTCYIPKGLCVKGYLIDYNKNQAFILGEELLKLNLKTLSVEELKEFTAYATIGSEKVVEIHHGNKVVKVPRGIPKWWVYPQKTGVIPCGDKYWIRKYGQDIRIFVDPMNNIVKRVKKGTYCIKGKLVSREKATLVSIDMYAKAKSVKLLKKLEFNKVSIIPFENYFLVFEQDNVAIFDRELKKVGELRLKGNLIFLTRKGNKFYFTSLEPFEVFTVFSLNLSKGKVEKLFSIKEKNIYRIHKILPLNNERLLDVSPPFKVCLSPTWQGDCLRYKFYKGAAQIIEPKQGDVVKRITIPEKARVYFLKKSFVYCLENKGCFFVNQRLEISSLGIYGSSDSSKAYEFLILYGSPDTYVIYSDGSYRKIPKGCYVRINSKTVFCVKSEREAELRDLNTWKILGKSKGVFYPDHVYRNVSLKRADRKVLVLKDNRVLKAINLSCSDLQIRKLIFNRDAFYVLYSNYRKTCMEGYKLNVD